MWWLTWFSSIPILLVAPRLSGCMAFIVAVGTHLIGDLNTWQYLSFIPPPVHVLLILVPACAFAVGIVLYRACLLRGAILPAWASLPAVWVAFEYVLAETSPNGTFGSLAYTQMNCLPIIQLASLAGCWIIAFCPLLFSTALAILIGNRGSVGSRKAIVLSTATMLACAFGFGFWRLHTPISGSSIRIGLLASDLPENLVVHGDEESLALFKRYSGKVKSLAGQGAKVIVMPEHLGDLDDKSPGGNTPRVDVMFSTVARQNKVYLVVGVDHAISNTVLLNQARIYSPDGKVAATYDKHHLIPGFESPRFAVGTSRTVLKQTDGTWGIAICKDMDFPALSREYSKDGIGLLLVPAYDFVVDGWLHGRMAILRGVEGGFSIARAPKAGLMTLTDDRGRIVAERASDSASFAILTAEIPYRHEATPYGYLGDWFAWFDFGLLLLILCTGLRTSSREKVDSV